MCTNGRTVFVAHFIFDILCFRKTPCFPPCSRFTFIGINWILYQKSSINGTNWHWMTWILLFLHTIRKPCHAHQINKYSRFQTASNPFMKGIFDVLWINRFFIKKFFLVNNRNKWLITMIFSKTPLLFGEKEDENIKSS